jgi:hypothetical protein
MDKRILWCGGSHLGNAKSTITALHSNSLKGIGLDFYITAAPVNRKWSANGGRYYVEGTSVGKNGHSPLISHDLSCYSAIVFIGQWIHPFKIFTGSMPLSSSLLHTLLNDVPLYGFSRWKGPTIQQWYNEPLELFPRIAGCPIYLIPDPPICADEYRQVPLSVKKAFASKLESFCLANGITLCNLPASVLDPDQITPKRFLRGTSDSAHMSDVYWQTVLDESLLPMVSRL